jgi:hypothetical protein
MTVASEGCPPCWRAYNASGIIRKIHSRILMKIMGQIIDECMMAILCSKKKNINQSPTYESDYAEIIALYICHSESVI